MFFRCGKKSTRRLDADPKKQTLCHFKDSNPQIHGLYGFFKIRSLYKWQYWCFWKQGIPQVLQIQIWDSDDLFSNNFNQTHVLKVYTWFFNILMFLYNMAIERKPGLIVSERWGFARAFCGASPPYTRHKCRLCHWVKMDEGDPSRWSLEEMTRVTFRVWAISHIRMMIGIIIGMVIGMIIYCTRLS